jgi:hypothetical protein
MSTVKRNLDALKSAFSQKAAGGGGDQSWKLFYPFWKMPDDSVAVVRFLPDLDEENSLGFLVENLQHELIINGERKKVPCLAMHGEHCPICELSRKYYDEKNDEMGKKYYRKKSYVGQVIVVESPIDHDQNMLVKLIEFGPKIFKQIQSAFQSGDLEDAPFELKGGYNFRIKKTKSGQYADYGTSSFAPKQTDLDDELIGALELHNLKDFRTKYVDRATLEAMLIADQTGQSFKDSEETPVVASLDMATKASESPAVTETVTPVPPATTNKQSVLDALRARAKASQA